MARHPDLPSLVWGAIVPALTSISCSKPYGSQRSFPPHFPQEPQPVLTHDATDLLLGPPGFLHGPGESRKLADRTDPIWVLNGFEMAELARLPFVVGQPIEKRLVLVLGEVGSDTDRLLARDAHDVINGGDVVVDGRGVPLG